jgi:hypothetical protein
VAFFRSTGERADVGDSAEVAELMKFHGGEKFLVISYKFLVAGSQSVLIVIDRSVACL